VSRVRTRLEIRDCRPSSFISAAKQAAEAAGRGLQPSDRTYKPTPEEVAVILEIALAPEAVEDYHGLAARDDLRVFYDVEGHTVAVLAILPKAQATAWLERYGVKS
jgi:hypothetical protein